MALLCAAAALLAVMVYETTAGGAVEVEEFLLGCLRLRGQARAMDIAKLSFDQHWLIKSQGKFLVCRKLIKLY